MMKLAPNSATMLAQLEAMFGDLPAELCDGLIELASTDPKDGKLKCGRLFKTDEREKMAQVAAGINAVPGKSVYVGASLRKPKTSKSRRATDADFYALTCAYADFDGLGDMDRAEALCREKGVEPSFKVYTGRHPHARAQFWFRLREPQRDPEVCRKLNRAIADALGGDVTVVNPGRVMRLGGSIAWPRKKGRIVELTEFVLAEGGA